MPQQGLFVDAGLLLLLVVGATDPAIIAKHRRLDGYSTDDFDLLIEIIEAGGGLVYVTPNTLTEASNLLRQHGEPERSVLVARFAELIERSDEVIVASAQAAQRSEFPRLGLTDAALLEVISEDQPLLTVDSDLYFAALATNERAAMHFSDLRL